MTIMENGYPKYDLNAFGPEGTDNAIGLYMKEKNTDFWKLGKELTKRLGRKKFRLCGESIYGGITYRIGKFEDAVLYVEEFPIETFKQLFNIE
jgi:hypothetical protein